LSTIQSYDVEELIDESKLKIATISSVEGIKMKLNERAYNRNLSLPTSFIENTLPKMQNVFDQQDWLVVRYDRTRFTY
jgi:hypothetical protein